MSEFSIKINKPAPSQIPPTNHSPREIKKNEAPVSKKRPWFTYCLITLLLIESATITFLVTTEKTPAFYELLPKNPSAVIYINKTPSKELLTGLNQDNYAWPPFALIKDSFFNLIGQNNLQANTLIDLVQEKMVLIILPESNSQPNWLLIASPAASAEKINEEIEKAKKNLSVNLNVITEPYRQIKIIQIKPLKNENPGVFLAVTNNYLFFSNNLAVVKQVIDKILR
jgi:hypothetical protein